MIVKALLKLFKTIFNAVLSLLPSVPVLPEFITTGFNTLFSVMSAGAGVLAWALTPTVFNAVLDFMVAMFVWHHFKSIILFVRKYILFWKV